MAGIGRPKILVGLVAGVVVVSSGAGAYALLHTRGTPHQAAERFIDAWQRGDVATMRATVTAPPADLAEQYQRLRTDLGVERTQVRLGGVRKTAGDTAVVGFTVTLGLRAVGTWRYQGALRLVVKERRWWVAWDSRSIHPDLAPGRRLAMKTRWLERGHILDSDGERLDVPGGSGSVHQLLGAVGPASAEDVKRLGAPYRVGDFTGRGGLQQAFERRLAGSPAAGIQVVDARGAVIKTLAGMPGKPGSAVRTTLDRGVQEAASKVVREQAKPTGFVAIRPSTGEILAVVNKPGGWNRSLNGRYPPGSTFKVVTAAALLAGGLPPNEVVECPKNVTIGGFRFRNFESEEFGGITFRDAFAHSCNTTFAAETTKRLSPAKVDAMAATFGFDQPLNVGVPAEHGRFPLPRGDVEFAAASFGQARVTASPLTMASVAATVASGRWRPPVLVTDPSPARQAQPRTIDPKVSAELRSMMRAVVSEGTAAGAGLPRATAGKTGTAEFGTGENPPTHAWFLGFRGDVAFAVIVENGGTGGKVAAPIAAEFLHNL